MCGARPPAPPASTTSGLAGENVGSRNIVPVDIDHDRDTDLIVIGAHNDDSDRGAAYFYAYDGVDWIEVDKISGPGSPYVQAAKMQVFGQVGVDMIAGPPAFDTITKPPAVGRGCFENAVA